jgi:hypothetical protein
VAPGGVVVPHEDATDRVKVSVMLAALEYQAEPSRLERTR